MDDILIFPGHWTLLDTHNNYTYLKCINENKIIIIPNHLVLSLNNTMARRRSWGLPGRGVGGGQYRTETLRGPPVLHAMANPEMPKLPRLLMQQELPALYGFLPLNWMLQKGPSPHPST